MVKCDVCKNRVKPLQATIEDWLFYTEKNGTKHCICTVCVREIAKILVKE